MITMFIICYRTPCAKSGCSGHTFRRWWVTVVFLWCFITKIWSDYHKLWLQCSAIGPHVPNQGAVVTLFGVDGLLLFLMVFHHKSMAKSSYMMITMFIMCYRTPCAKSGCSGHTFRRWWVIVVFDGVSLKKYGQIIINYDYNVHHLL